MGSLELTCPLCCTETFQCHKSLKHHLLNILDNLNCSICNTKFTKVIDLVNHFDNACKRNVNEDLTIEVNEEEFEFQSPISADNLIVELSEDVNLEELDSEEIVESYITDPEEELIESYYCATCNINFSDITTHISTFHEGQEVSVVQESDSENTNELVESGTDMETELNEDDIEENDVENACLDKAGRLYTRKMVKIDQFWNDETEMQPNKSKRKPRKPAEEKILKVEQAVGPYVCDVCSTEFSSHKSLQLHKRMHVPIAVKAIEPPAMPGPRETFVCTICMQTYDKEYEEAHKSFHNKELNYNCPVCNKKFATEELMEMHKNAHTSSTKFLCGYCKKGFKSVEAMRDHETNVCQRREYQCQYCGRRFSRPHEKVKHERIHTGEKPHVCGVCGKTFRVNYCLTLHMRTHSGTRPYECKQCGKRFKAQSVYTHHMLIHSDVRSYKCPLCPKAFKNGVQLAGHKNSHTKPFSCKECNRPFASLYAVREHQFSHQRVNNLKYKCCLCGAKYARTFALRDHMKEQHSAIAIDPTVLAGEVFDPDDFKLIDTKSVILADDHESMLIDFNNDSVIDKK